MALKETPAFKKFLSNNTDIFLKEIPQPFTPMKPKMDEIGRLFEDIIEVSDTVEIPNSLIQQIIEFVEYWNMIYEQVKSYEPISDQSNGLNKWSQINAQVNGLHQYIHSGFDNGSNNLSAYCKVFLGVYATIMALKQKKCCRYSIED